MSKETSFVKNAEELAKQKMDAINPELSSKFKFLIKFLSQFPEACSKPRSKKMQNKVGQEEHIEYLARSFHESRLPRKPTPPTTVPDEVVSIVLNISFNIQPENLERIKEEHRFSMAAENIRRSSRKMRPQANTWMCVSPRARHTTVWQSMRPPRSQRQSSLLPLVLQFRPLQ